MRKSRREGVGRKTKRCSLVLVVCVELVRTARKERRSLVSSIVPLPVPSHVFRLSSCYRSAPILRSCRLVLRACLVSSRSYLARLIASCQYRAAAFSSFRLASCLYRAADHPVPSLACACYLIGHRLALSNEERKNETPHETPHETPLARRGNETRNETQWRI